MSNKIDPSYLSYIHDGLHSGSIHAENASSLPEGLTGLYEASFLGELNVKESQHLLKRFGYFSLLKKEVSCHFVAIALEEPESEIIDFISTYSKWFNSAQSGKFSIYHERLRTYILSSIAQLKFDEINNQIIALSQTALANRSNDEWGYYALEYLSNHLLIASMISGNGDAFKKIAYDTAHWNRQIEISKGFEWSKKMLNKMMRWAAKYDDEEVIECALNKVDLHHMEQNDAPLVLELIAQNELDVALNIILNLGKDPIDGYKKMFGIYLYCLLKLTFFDYNFGNIKKEVLNKIIFHFDESIPEDSDVFNWDDDFSDFKDVILKMAEEWDKLNLDFSIIFKRTNYKSSIWGDFLLNNNKFKIQEPSKALLISIGLIQGEDLTSIFYDFLSKELYSQTSMIDKNEIIEKDFKNADNDFLNAIAFEIEKLKNYINIAPEISKESKQNIIAWNIAPLFSKMNNFKKAYRILSFIENKNLEERGILNITSPLIILENEAEINEKFNFIHLNSYKNTKEDKHCLFIHGRQAFSEFGWVSCLDFINKNKDDLIKKCFIAGCVDKALFSTHSIDIGIIKRVLPYIENDYLTYYDFLVGFALRSLFFDRNSIEINNRLCHSLNIQWAIDIKNALSEN